VITTGYVPLHQATVTQLVVFCHPVRRAELGQEVLCQATGPSGSCPLPIRGKTADYKHYNLISKEASAEPGGWRTALQGCCKETKGVEGPIQGNRVSFHCSARTGFSVE
jgi:hypothetical protein